MPGPEFLGDPHVTLVPGFVAAGVPCGIKATGDLDLCLVFSPEPCTAAAVFTTNRVQAAPVIYDRSLMEQGERIQAVVINSGNANACTGAQGMADVQRTASIVGECLNIPSNSVFVMSTGVIGQSLPMDRLSQGIMSASKALSRHGGKAAAQAIMTTDTCPKQAAVRIALGDRPVTIAGMCKGSGMIHPNMATMLALVVTDAAVELEPLRIVLQGIVSETFNMVTVDRDTSTNDTLLILANGLAGNRAIAETDSADYRAFLDGLRAVCAQLAQAIARDGEGATKFITVRVTGAAKVDDARQVARSIAGSNLVKTAVYGQDANWGRVLCAAGYSGVSLEPDRWSLWLEDKDDSLHLVHAGEPYQIDEERAAEILSHTDICWRLDLGQGAAEAEAWTCDLTHAYIDINAHYRT